MLCTYLIYSKTFDKQKTIKNIFFSKSTAWDTFLSKKFTRIKSCFKLSRLSNAYPYIGSTPEILPYSLYFKKTNETLGITKKMQFTFQNLHKPGFSFSQSFLNPENGKNLHTSLPSKAVFQSNLVASQLYSSIKNFNSFFLGYDKFKAYSNSLHENRNYFLQQYQRSNQNTCMHQRPIVNEGEWVQEGDLIADGAASVGGELSLGKTLLIAYMPWEGYNFEDAILINQRLIYDDLYTSIHIERYEIEISDTEYGLEQITRQIPDVSRFKKRNLDTNGIIRLGSWVQENDILVGKVTPIKIKQLSGHEKLLADVLERQTFLPIRETSLRVPKNVFGRVVHVELLESENIPLEIAFQGFQRVHVYIAEKRTIQVGDKMSGRHGNKGIVSKIVPQQDMPYLPDGSSVDMVLNPLGVPSRMNVGQIFECLLGLAGKELHEEFKISCFDEMNGPEASRSLTYSKLFQARLKTGKKWLFNPHSSGKIKLFDGRTGECFDQTVTVGQSYMLKLIHLVDEKIHARSTGPYSLVTQQPLRGRSKHGGQRLGEMEVWALEGFGAAYTLQELLTNKSDDIKGRHQVMQSILEHKNITLGTPESFKVLLSELQSLCLNIGVYSITNVGIRKKIDIMQLS
jgi:DNA-directed RNA polymerase subunit beta